MDESNPVNWNHFSDTLNSEYSMCCRLRSFVMKSDIPKWNFARKLHESSREDEKKEYEKVDAGKITKRHNAVPYLLR